MKRNKLTLVLHVFEFILITAIMLVYIGIMHRSTKNEFLANHAAELSQGWELMREGGSREKVVYPVAVHSKDGEICTYINTLPEIRDDDKLLFYSDVDTVITVDGAIRYRYETSENPFPGETVKNVIHQVGLIASDTGKEIRIIKGEPNCKAGKLKLVAIGDNYGLFVMMFRIYGLSFGLSCVILFLVFVITLLNIYLNIRFRDNTNIYTLIVGIFLVAIWCISNSMFFQYLFNISYVDGFMRYQVAMMLPIPFVMHLNRIQKYRYQRQYSIFESIVIVNFIVMNYLQAFTKYSFNDTMAAMCIPVAIVPVFAMITVFRDIAIGRAKEYKYMAAGYCGLCVFGFIELFLSGSGVLGSATYNGFFILVGIYFLLLMSLFVLLTNVIDVRNEAEDAVRANKMKSGFLARMSHEIRTPINAVLGMNEMILRESKESNIRDYAMDIKGAGNSLLYIINDILDLSKI